MCRLFGNVRHDASSDLLRSFLHHVLPFINYRINRVGKVSVYEAGVQKRVLT